MPLRLLTAASALSLVPAAFAQGPGSTQTRGEIALETRVFADDDDGRTVDHAAGLASRLEWRHTQGANEERVRLFGRWDALDADRSVLVAEEAYLQFRDAGFRMRLGADLINWTATEAFHPADVINARNLDSDIENFDKIGEPMLSLQWSLAESTVLQVLAMPYYTETLFPPSSSRLAFAPPEVDLQDRRRLFREQGYAGSDFGPQLALRLSQTLGSADVSVHVLQHMDRQQPLTAVSTEDGKPVLVYQTAQQVGVTYQQAFESGLIAKFEGAYRQFLAPDDPGAAEEAQIAFLGEAFPQRDHTALALSFEYTLNHDWGESTYIAEAQKLFGVDPEWEASVSPFQNDLLLGLRLAPNGTESREILLSGIVDLDQARRSLLNLAYQQRLGEQYTVKLGLRLFDAPQTPFNTGFDALRRGDNIRLTLIRHF